MGNVAIDLGHEMGSSFGLAEMWEMANAVTCEDCE